MKRKTWILGSIGGFLLFLLIRDAFRLVRLGCYLVLYPLLGAALAVVMSQAGEKRCRKGTDGAHHGYE